MSNFYTSVYLRGDYIYLRGFDKGQRVVDKIKYAPYMFVSKENGQYRTVSGKPVEKIQLESISDAKDFNDRYKDVSNFEVYGFDSYLYTYIYDNYSDEIDYDYRIVNIGTIDIETKYEGGFPNIKEADQEITAITLRSKGKSYVFGCGQFVTNDSTIEYFQCKDEYFMLQSFLKCWEFLDLDIVTGWNIEFFDIPYLVNRIKRLFNEKEAKRLSPWKMLNERTVEFRGKENQSYTLPGLSILDYYQVYRKFSFGNQESYKLDYIAQEELGQKKIDFSDIGDLNDLYEKDFQKYIEYNIMDVLLVERLEDKLKFLEQIMALAYDAKINYNDTMTTVRSWDVIVHNYLMNSKIVVPQFSRTKNFEPLVGGYVKDPKIGLSKWVVSLDLTSLYPHLMMQYNISNETFVRRIDNFPSIDELVSGRVNISDYLNEGEDYSITANGCCYRKDKQGFFPALMEKIFNDRKKYKKLMVEAKKSFEITKSYDDEKLIARYHNFQMAKKIQMNSGYGAIANTWFRWFDFNHAEAITTSGQLTIKWIARKLNEYLNKMLRTKNVDYVIASDTDSVYLELDY